MISDTDSAQEDQIQEEELRSLRKHTQTCFHCVSSERNQQQSRRLQADESQLLHVNNASSLLCTLKTFCCKISSRVPVPPQDTSAHRLTYSDSWRVFAPGVSGVLRCGFTPQLISDTNCTIKSELKFKKLFQRAVLLLHVIWESHVTWELLRPPDYKPGMFRLFKQEWDPFTQHKIKPRRTGKDSNMIQKHKIIFKKNYQKTSSVHLKQTKCLKQDEHVSVMGIFYICYLMKTVSLSGLLKFCTVGFCGIGTLIDFILIAMQVSHKSCTGTS